MEEMVSMKLDKKRVKELNSPSTMAVESDAPEYPWGLEIRLESEALKKLEVDLKDYAIGDEVMVYAKCTVKELRQSERHGGGDSKTMELQITEMCMGEDGDMDEDGEVDWDDDSEHAAKKRGY